MPALLDAAIAQQSDARAQDSQRFRSAQLLHFLAIQDAAEAFRHWQCDISPTVANGLNARSIISQQIALLDELICEQLNEILHSPELQAMEARWLGLWNLVDSAGNADNIKIKLLNASWKDLVRDMERAPDADQTSLFDIVYNQEFGSPGGEPFGVLLGDYQVSHRPDSEHPYDDIFTLQGISRTAAAAFAPFVCGASPRLFGLDSFQTLGMPINLPAVFEHKEYLRWHSLREQEDSRFLGVTLPRVLMRRPYPERFASFRGIRFQEYSDAQARNYVWGNACFAFGCVLIREFAEVGWFAHIRGVSRDYLGGGLVNRFPSLPYATDSRQHRTKMITDVLITDFQERDLSELGLISLCHCYDTPLSAFNSTPSLQRPKAMGSKSADANARISAMLQQVLCASRFAQYIKVMIRDKVGSYIRPQECERLLQQWLDQYTTGRDDLAWEMLARYPLREARVEVTEAAGQPGVYQSIIHLKTHYTVDQLVSELRLTTALNPAAFGTVN